MLLKQGTGNRERGMGNSRTIWEHSDVFPHLRYMKGWDFMHYGIEKSYGNVILVGLERGQQEVQLYPLGRKR